MDSDAVHSCTETSSIAWKILRAQSDAGASLQFDRGPMALPYGRERRLEGLRDGFPSAVRAVLLAEILMPCPENALDAGKVGKTWE